MPCHHWRGIVLCGKKRAFVSGHPLHKPAGTIGHAAFAKLPAGSAADIADGIVRRQFGDPVLPGNNEALAHLQVFNGSAY